MKRIFYWIAIASVASAVLTSCESEHREQERATHKINTWIYQTMDDWYYWTDELPSVSTLNTTIAPDEFFEKLLSPHDRFSWISESAQENSNYLSGVEKNLGFKYLLGRVSAGNDTLLALVLHVYPDTDADAAHLQRGHLIRSIDGKYITVSNYQQLFAATDSVKLLVYKPENRDLYSIKVMPKEMQINPIYAHKIFQYDNQKIGYLFYDKFIPDNGDDSKIYENDLKQVFSEFQSAQINELVVDLRYNTGGYFTQCLLLSSMIAPPAADTAFVNEYNDLITNYVATHTTGLSLTDRFFKPNNLPNCYVGDLLHRVFFLVGTNTASASEAVINALKPYMDVILIGDTTYGKNYGSVTLADSENKNNNWVLQPIVMKMYNSAMQSDYENGFAPDVRISEMDNVMKDIWEPLGSENELLLSRTLNEYIIGKSPANRAPSNNKTDAPPFIPLPFSNRSQDYPLVIF